MSKTLKIALAVVAVLVVIVVAIPFFLNADQFRPLLERKLSAALGREVKMGKLGLKLMQGVVTADEITIADDPAFGSAAFLTAKGLRIAVQMKPLISEKKLIVDGIEIVQPQVNLIQSKDLRWNFSTIGSSAPAKPAATAPDAASSDLDLSVRSLTLSEGKVNLKLAANPQPMVIDQLLVQAENISKDSEMPLKIMASLPAGGKFNLDGKIGPVSAADMTMTPLTAQLSIGSLDLEKSGFSPPTAAIRGVATYVGTLASAKGIAHIKGRLTLDKLQVGQNSRPSPKPIELGYDVEHSLAAHSGTLKEGKLNAGKALASFGGTYELKPGDTQLAFNLKGDAMPVDELSALLPSFGIFLPKEATLRGGTLSIASKIAGSSTALSSQGNVALSNVRVSGYSLGSSISTAAQLAGIKVGPDTLISSLRSNFSNSPAATKLEGLSLVVADLGNLSGGLTLDAKQNLSGKLTAQIQSSGTVADSALQSVGVAGGAKTMTIPITVAGTATNPQFIADTKAVAKQAATSAASQVADKYVPGAGSVIQGLFGGKKKK